MPNSDAAEESAAVAPVAEGASVCPDCVKIGMGTPPVPRRPDEVGDSVPFAVRALSAESVVEPSNADVRPPSRPGEPVPALVPDVKVLLAPVCGTVWDDASGMEALSEAPVASVRAAEEVAEAVPSMMLVKPTVIAPREDEVAAPVSLVLLSKVPDAVGAGLMNGATPIVPTLAEPSAERVVRAPEEAAVGGGWSTGRRPPDASA